MSAVVSRTRRAVPPPSARDPAFQPRTSPFRSAQRPLPVSTRSRRIPLLGRRHRSRCHALLAGFAPSHTSSSSAPSRPVGRASRRRTAHGQESHFPALFFPQVQALRWTRTTGFTESSGDIFHIVSGLRLGHWEDLSTGPARPVQDGLRRSHNFRVGHNWTRSIESWSAWDDPVRDTCRAGAIR